jgi:hypothetical protein
VLEVGSTLFIMKKQSLKNVTRVLLYRWVISHENHGKASGNKSKVVILFIN